MQNSLENQEGSEKLLFALLIRDFWTFSEISLIRLDRIKKILYKFVILILE
jgi:hypothetical protein